MGTVHKDSKARDTLFPAGDLEQLPGQLQPALGETVLAATADVSRTLLHRLLHSSGKAG